MLIMNNNASVTAKRKNYVLKIMENACRVAAQDLTSGATTPDVAIHALGQLWAAYNPHTGEGHAAAMRDQISAQVDAYIAEIEEGETDAA